MNVIYHSVNAEPQKASYTEFEVVDFFIKSDRNLVRNSVRIEGELTVNSAAATRLLFADNVGYNPRLGIHAAIKSINVSFDGQVVENLQQGYGRYINMVESATGGKDDTYDSLKLCELKVPSEDAAFALSSGVKPDGAANFSNADFSFKPSCCLNKMDNDLPLARVGLVKISVVLARTASFLVGNGVVATTNYNLSDVKLTYRTVEPVPVPQVNMRTVSVIKGTLQNPFANVDARVNSMVESVAVSFVRQADENSLTFDPNTLAQPEGISELQFLINDSTNGYLQYVIDSPSDMVVRGLEALGNAGHQQCNYENIRGNNGFISGLKFPQVMNFMNNKLSVQVKSNASNVIPYNIYMYFHNVVSV